MFSLSFKTIITREIASNSDSMIKYFNYLVSDVNPDMKVSEFSKLMIEQLQEGGIFDTIFLTGVSNTLKASVLLLIILLTVLLIYIQREICRPLGKLNKAIQDFNCLNGYHSAKHSCNEIEELTHNFNLMSEQIESSKRRKNELISYISHDLKTPLTSILGYTQRLINPGIPQEEKRLKYYHTILTKAGDIDSMVEELSTYVLDEIEEVKLENVNLKKFFECIVEEYEGELQTYHINLITKIELGEQRYCKLDINRMRRVFANLFSNSVVHGGKGITIKLKISIQNDKIQISMENNGKELPEGEYHKVFEVLYQADSARTNGRKGRGLGLALVKQIIDKHDGEINAYRPAQGGFGIKFTIPIT